MAAATSVDRFALEKQFIADLRAIFTAQFNRAIRSPLAIHYGQFQQELAGVMARNLLTAFRSAGAALIIGHDLLVSQGAFDAIGRRWAIGYANELASKTAQNTRQLAQEAVYQVIAGANAARPGDRQARIELALAAIFLAESRLENIAATEVTRGISMGENAVILAFPGSDRNGQKSSDKLIPIWQCVEVAPGVPDASVCPVCAPFDREGPEVWSGEFPHGPPAHPRCRCYRRWVRASEWARSGRRRAA